MCKGLHVIAGEVALVPYALVWPLLYAELL
jgi:hypothetical protein